MFTSEDLQVVKIGAIAETMEDQVTVAIPYEKRIDGEYKPVNKMPHIRVKIAYDWDKQNNYIYINTEWKQDGIVCFLPIDYAGCAITKIKIVQIFQNSINGIPLDYYKDDKPISDIYIGDEMEYITSIHPTTKRIQREM